MKMKCTEGSDFGKYFKAGFEIPCQEEIDNGKFPYFSVAVDGDYVKDDEGSNVKDKEGCFVIKDSLLEVLYDADIASEDTAGILAVDALDLFLDAVDEYVDFTGASKAESAELVANWLEDMATQIRSKFDQKS